MRTAFPAAWLALFLALAAQPLAAQDAAAREQGIRLYEQGRHADARRELTAFAKANPRDARAAHYLGLAHQRERELDRAIEWLEKAVRLDDGRSDYHLALAGALGERAASANPARQALLARRIRTHLDRAVTLDPRNVDARFGLVQFYAVAPGVMGGSPARAREQAAEVRRLDPYRGVFALAIAHIAEKNPAGAEAEYRAALRQYPDSAALYTALVSLHGNAKQWDRAFEVIDARLARRPDDRATLYQLGRLGALSGQRLDRAEAALRDYLRQPVPAGSPPHAAAHWRLGMVLEQQGRTEPAREQFQAALRLDPAHREARAALEKLGRRAS
jgi:tetratricopeptide (TPR) repeat protein